MTHNQVNSIISKLTFLQTSLCLFHDQEDESYSYGLFSILGDIIQVLKEHLSEFED